MEVGIDSQSNTTRIENQRRIENTFEMDIGNAAILHFAPAGGFEVQNEHQYSRRDNLSIDYPARAINEANAAEVKYHEQKQTGADPLSQDFEYKVGILNLRRVGNTIYYDTKPSTFVMANDDKRVGLSTPDGLGLRAELGTPLASADILFTTEDDGSSLMIVQNRSAKNASYKKMLGAPIAGTNEHRVSKKTGALEPLNTDELKSFIFDEMEEEIGVLPEYIIGGKDGVKITGIAIDKLRVHYEMLMMARVNMSAKELAKRARENMLVKRKAFHFAESVLAVPGDPESIRKMLLLKTPIPPTHTAAFIAAGRMMILEMHGEKAAEEWICSLEIEIKENIEDINRIVREATNGKEQGYNPRLTPEEQGLMSADVALHNAGLLVPLT